MRISDWSSDVCSSDLNAYITPRKLALMLSNEMIHFSRASLINWDAWARNIASNARLMKDIMAVAIMNELQRSADAFGALDVTAEVRSEEHTSELQSLMRISYAVFCLKKKTHDWT